MFTREILGLTLTKQVANNLFQNIRGVKFRNDESFLATMRALLYERVPEGESVYLETSSSGYDANSIKNSPARDCVRAFLRRTQVMDGKNGILSIHSFTADKDSNTIAFEKVEEGINLTLKGNYKPLNTVTIFLEQKGKFRAKVYTSEEYKNTIIFVENLDMKRWHMLASLIPRYFPWYFKDAPRTKDEDDLLVTLTKRYSPKFEEAIEEFAKKFDFRTQFVKDSLRGFETRFERRKLDRVKANVDRIRDAIQDIERQFAEKYQQLNETILTQVGLEEKIRLGGGDECSDLLNYFLCNKSLNLVNVSDGRIEFIVTTEIANFDPDIFDSYIRNRESYFYRHYRTGNKYENAEQMTDDRIERLMRAIFEKERLKLRVCAFYYLNFDNGDYGARSNYSYPADMLRDHVPNQHIDVYACLGGNSRYIRQAMMDHDYIAAIESCTASAKSMNLTEHNTGTFFMEKICAKDAKKIITMPDGTTKTPLEAVIWLEEQDAANVKKEEKTDE